MPALNDAYRRACDAELRENAADLLIGEKPKTARELAKILYCSRQAVYAKIARLKELGYTVKETTKTQRGGPTTYFQVTSAPK